MASPVGTDEAQVHPTSCESAAARSSSSVEDSEHGRALPDKGSSVNSLSRHGLNAGYPPNSSSASSLVMTFPSIAIGPAWACSYSAHHRWRDCPSIMWDNRRGSGTCDLANRSSNRPYWHVALEDFLGTEVTSSAPSSKPCVDALSITLGIGIRTQDGRPNHAPLPAVARSPVA